VGGNTQPGPLPAAAGKCSSAGSPERRRFADIPAFAGMSAAAGARLTYFASSNTSERAFTL